MGGREHEGGPPQRVSGAPRLSAIDVFRGLTILEVVAHHTTGVALRYVTGGSLLHEVLIYINRILHFAVPAFVFLSCVVLTNSLLKKFTPGRYYWRRLTRGGWPYLLWSGLYMLWYVWTGQRPPETLTSPERWWFYLANGKASYHLYFLLVALQVYLILPLLLPLARRRPYITLALLGGAALQFGAYLLNREVLHLTFPASTALWYVLPIVLGVAVGARFADFPEWWRTRRRKFLPLLAASFVAYLPPAVAAMKGEPVNTLNYNLSSWLFTSLMAVALLGLAYRLHRSGPKFLRTGLGLLGTVSLQIYLLHPALVQALERWWSPSGGSPAQLVGQMLCYGVIATLLPAVVGRLLLRTPLSVALFGR